ncbi:MAG TPA: GAF domain-containing protein [Chthoniobacterales bacterium]
MQANADIEHPKPAKDLSWRGQDDLRLTLDTIPVLAWCHRLDGSSEFFNKRWHDYTGLSAEEAQGWGWTVTIHPHDLQRLLDVWEGLRVAGKAGGLEARLRRLDGVYRWFLFQAEPLFDSSGSLIKWYGANTDIDDRKRAEALLTGENQILELSTGGSSLPEILDRTCRLVDEFSDDGMAAILLLDEDGKRLRWGAGPRFPAAFATALDGIEIGPEVGSCGTAAHNKEQVISSDIATDPRWVKYRDFAFPFGLRAGWSTPVFASDGKVLGTFAIYWREPRSPTPDHHQMIRRISHLTAVAIERKRAAEALRASEKFARGQTEALTHALDAMVRESSADRIAEHVLRTMVEQLNAHSSAVWLRSEQTGLMGLKFALEEGRFKTKADSTISAISPPLRIDEIEPWLEVFRTGRPFFVEDIRVCGNFPWHAHVLALGVIAILVVPMKVSGGVEGLIGIRFAQQRRFRSEEMDLAQALANQAMLALKLTGLSAQRRQAAVMEERNRMARDIHDTLAQGFTGVIVQLEAAEEAIAQKREAKAADHLDRAGEIARESLREARRSVQALRPQALEEKRLSEVLKDLIENMTADTTVRTTFNLLGEPQELPAKWEADLLRIGQEALTNVLRHAQASEFQVELAFESGELRLILRDNGRGFDPDGKNDGFGLQGMRERAESMGGSLTFQSVEGTGTVVSMILPITPVSDSERS